ncbi:P-loop containing nucleoside triphosphate hydrolase protein [Xylaria digitata]|nr:P-loop containing nucleoside triphosphate hydrolase protein [Xylaria digitata]
MDRDPLNRPLRSSARLRSQKRRTPASNLTSSLSDLWKPTKESILQWIKDLPVHTEYEEPFEPARYSTLKHSLDHDDSDSDDSSFEGHRRKRVKTSPAVTYRSSVESRRSRLVSSSRSLVRRVSATCKRAITPSRYLSASKRSDSRLSRGATPAPEPTPSPGTPSFMLIDRPKMRFVFVGDAQCGKSSILLRFYRDTFTQHYNPTQYELFNKVVTVDEQDTDVELWDTAGDAALEQLGRLSYLVWDAVFLCFSVSCMRSFNSARTEWIRQIRRHAHGVPLIFVGMKTDKRVGPSLWAPLYPNLEARITATEGTMAATAMGATRYVECSAKTGQGINGVFEEGVRAVFKRRKAAEKQEKKAQNFSSFAELLCLK